MVLGMLQLLWLVNVLGRDTSGQTPIDSKIMIVSNLNKIFEDDYIADVFKRGDAHEGKEIRLYEFLDQLDQIRKLLGGGLMTFSKENWIDKLKLYAYGCIRFLEENCEDEERKERLCMYFSGIIENAVALKMSH